MVIVLETKIFSSFSLIPSETLDYKDLYQYGGRSQKCRLLQSSDPIWNFSSFKWPLQLFGIIPSAPTTTGVTFVFALQSLDIPLLSLCLQRLVHGIFLLFLAHSSGRHWSASSLQSMQSTTRFQNSANMEAQRSYFLVVYSGLTSRSTWISNATQDLKGWKTLK